MSAGHNGLLWIWCLSCKLCSFGIFSIICRDFNLEVPGTKIFLGRSDSLVSADSMDHQNIILCWKPAKKLQKNYGARVWRVIENIAVAANLNKIIMHFLILFYNVLAVTVTRIMLQSILLLCKEVFISYLRNIKKKSQVFFFFFLQTL